MFLFGLLGSMLIEMDAQAHNLPALRLHYACITPAVCLHWLTGMKGEDFTVVRVGAFRCRAGRTQTNF
ncbi:hypothetical protein GQ57_00740 [Burkholderia sp. MSh2]|uniref:hypothetical protein n=1 Tax=Burkholderia TaxID=32008 RepID=UPI0004D7F15C|nr:MULTISPECIES: hypothetical protein [Burkholderia]KEZ07634.1 hypothetical protein GQ57_00740 [Burkholderia sp. MSh2]